MLWPARQVPEKRGGHPQATPGHRATAKHRMHRPAEGEGPSGIPTASTVLPRAAQTVGPWTGDRPPLGPSAPPAAPGPQLCPSSGWGLSSRNPPSVRAGVSLHLRHSCTQGALPTCTPRPFSQKPLQGPRSTHCPPRAPASTHVSQLVWGSRVPRAPCLSPSMVPSQRAGACPHPVPSERQTRQDVAATRRQSAGLWGPLVPEQSGAWARGWGRRTAGWGPAGGRGHTAHLGASGTLAEPPLFVLAPIPFQRV